MAHTPLLDPDSVDGHPLPIDELKGIKAVESIDLSDKGLRVASAMIISTCIAGNESLRSLKYALPSKPVESVAAGNITHSLVLFTPWLCSATVWRAT